MPKKQTTKKHTQVKDLPRKEKKLSAGEMKKVKGGTDTTAKQIKVKGGSEGWVVEDFGEFPAR